MRSPVQSRLPLPNKLTSYRNVARFSFCVRYADENNDVLSTILSNEQLLKEKECIFLFSSFFFRNFAPLLSTKVADDVQKVEFHDGYCHFCADPLFDDGVSGIGASIYS